MHHPVCYDGDDPGKRRPYSPSRRPVCTVTEVDAVFDPNQLIYCGCQRGIDVFSYNGVRIDAAVVREHNEQVLYLGLGRGLSGTVMAGLMTWFGIDWHREYSEIEFPDKSRYLVQEKAA